MSNMNFGKTNSITKNTHNMSFNNFNSIKKAQNSIIRNPERRSFDRITFEYRTPSKTSH